MIALAKTVILTTSYHYLNLSIYYKLLVLFSQNNFPISSKGEGRNIARPHNAGHWKKGVRTLATKLY